MATSEEKDLDLEGAWHSLDATLKYREQIEDMVVSNFSDLRHIDSKGVDHVEKDFSMINKL